MVNKNVKCLPDYVFDRPYEEYVFTWADNLLTDIGFDSIMKVYCSILMEKQETHFTIYEVPENGTDLFLLGNFEVSENMVTDIKKNLIEATFHGIQYYYTAACMQAYFISEPQHMCVYWERDLEAMIIGCTKEIAAKFREGGGELINSLEGYINMVDNYNRPKGLPNWIKKKLRANYG